MTPDELYEHEKRVLKEYEELKAADEKNFPGKFWILEIALAARAVLEIRGVTLPLMIVILAPPSSGKSTVLILVESLPGSYSLDKFTSKAFQSHMAGRRLEDLEKNDLLTKIKNRILLVSDLAPLFSARDEDIVESFGILTRLLDGKGLKTSSGVHGERSSGPVFFVWLGGAVEVSKNIWNLIAKLGPKMFFLRVKLDMTYDEEQKKIIDNMTSEEEYEGKLDDVRKVLQKYWEIVTSGPFFENGKATWNKSNESKEVMLKIVKHAQLLARLRGYVPVDNTEGTGGSNYGFQEPIIEDPERATLYLYNLVRGHALCKGRNYIIDADISIIKQIVLSSASKERVELLKLLIKNNGEVTVSQMMEARGITRSTALKTMKLLEILGLVDEIKIPGVTKNISGVRLKEHFRWILENLR